MALGHRTELVHLSQLPWWQRFDVVVLHRPRLGLRLQFILATLRAAGTQVVADFDDLVFAPELAEHSPGVVNQLIGLAVTQKQYASHAAALTRMARITVSTPPLQAAVMRQCQGAAVTVLPNAIHRSWRSLALRSRRAAGTPATLGYCPGTRSHDLDFATVIPALERVLDRHPDLRLRITGPLEFTLRARPDQIVHQDRVSFADYAAAVAAADINLAPLEDSPFTRCKSALKVIEAGWLGVPTLASPLPDAQRFLGAGAVIANTDDWFCILDRLVSDESFYATHADGLRERVLAHADIDRVAQDWLRFVERVP